MSNCRFHLDCEIKRWDHSLCSFHLSTTHRHRIDACEQRRQIQLAGTDFETAILADQEDSGIELAEEPLLKLLPKSSIEWSWRVGLQRPPISHKLEDVTFIDRGLLGPQARNRIRDLRIDHNDPMLPAQ